MTLNHVHTRFEGGDVERRRHLTHAASALALHRNSVNNGSFKVAIIEHRVAQHLVDGKCFARLDFKTIKRAGRKSDVCRARFVVYLGYSLVGSKAGKLRGFDMIPGRLIDEVVIVNVDARRIALCRNLLRRCPERRIAKRHHRRHQHATGSCRNRPPANRIRRLSTMAGCRSVLHQAVLITADTLTRSAGLMCSS